MAASGNATGSLEDANYIFTAFTRESESNMYVYTSQDGEHFDLLKGPAYEPTDTLLRDPSPIHHHDGYFYITHTTSWASCNFALARSRDLLAWEHFHTIPITVSNITRTWAPEFFRDPLTGKLHIIVSLSPDLNNFHPHFFTAKDETLTEWTEPVKMKGFEPNFIDTFVVVEGGVYHAFTKNEDTKWIEHAVAERLEGPWEFVQTGNHSGWNHLEGPCLTKTMDGKWRIYADGYEWCFKKYMVAESEDLYEWTGYRELPGLSGFVRHGTVLKIDRERIEGTVR